MDMPEMKSRDMATHLDAVVETHRVIRQGIQKRAEEHEAYARSRNAELNAGAKLSGKT